MSASPYGKLREVGTLERQILIFRILVLSLLVAIPFVAFQNCAPMHFKKMPAAGISSNTAAASLCLESAQDFNFTVTKVVGVNHMYRFEVMTPTALEVPATWSFGDGTPEAVSMGSDHVYAATGNYEGWVRGKTCAGFKTKAFSVAVVDDPPPTCNLPTGTGLLISIEPPTTNALTVHGSWSPANAPNVPPLRWTFTHPATAGTDSGPNPEFANGTQASFQLRRGGMQVVKLAGTFVGQGACQGETESTQTFCWRAPTPQLAPSTFTGDLTHIPMGTTLNWKIANRSFLPDVISYTCGAAGEPLHTLAVGVDNFDCLFSGFQPDYLVQVFELNPCDLSEVLSASVAVHVDVPTPTATITPTTSPTSTPLPTTTPYPSPSPSATPASTPSDLGECMVHLVCEGPPGRGCDVVYFTQDVTRPACCASRDAIGGNYVADFTPNGSTAPPERLDCSGGCQPCTACPTRMGARPTSSFPTVVTTPPSA